MNKRQKLLYSFTKWNYKYNKLDFNNTKAFKHYYWFMKWNYKHISDEEIQDILKWKREHCQPN